MKNFINSLTKTFAVALSIGICVSCTDTWDEHYSVSPSAPTETLLKLISENPDASNFLKVLETTKVLNGDKPSDKTYASLLGGDQFLTVWVPLNNSISEEEWNAYTKEGKTAAENLETAKVFLNNHISRYNYLNDGSVKRVAMMSTKHYDMSAKGIGTATIANSNEPCTNGIIHTLSSKLDYNPNIYEYLTTSEEYADNLGAFLLHFTKKEIDTEKSISAGYYNENAELVYADSVMVEKSIILDKFGYINKEDSLYNVILPRGSKWQEAYDRAVVRYQYNYYAKADSDSLTYLRTNSALLTDAFFNMNKDIQPYNNPENGYTLVSTTFDYKNDPKKPLPLHKYADPFGANSQFVFTDSIPCSNGKIYICDEWPFDPAYTYEAPIVIEAEGENATLMSKGLTKTIATVKSFYNADSTVLYKPSESQIARYNYKSSWTATYRLPQTLSGWNNFYIVVAPCNITPDKRGTVAKSNQMACSFTYSEDGVSTTYSMQENDKDKTFYNDVNKLDTILVGTINMNECFYEQTFSGITMDLRSKVSSGTKYSKEVFLDCIIVEPTTAPEE